MTLQLQGPQIDPEFTASEQLCMIFLCLCGFLLSFLQPPKTGMWIGYAKLLLGLYVSCPVIDWWVYSCPVFEAKMQMRMNKWLPFHHITWQSIINSNTSTTSNTPTTICSNISNNSLKGHITILEKSDMSPLHCCTHLTFSQNTNIRKKYRS